MANNGVDTIYDELRANIVREVKGNIAVGVEKVVEDKTWKSGFKVVYINDGSSITIELRKGAKRVVVAKESYKGSAATANNAERALAHVQKTAWTKLRSEIAKMM